MIRIRRRSHTFDTLTRFLRTPAFLLRFLQVIKAFGQTKLELPFYHELFDLIMT